MTGSPKKPKCACDGKLVGITTTHGTEECGGYYE